MKPISTIALAILMTDFFAGCNNKQDIEPSTATDKGNSVESLRTGDSDNDEGIYFNTYADLEEFLHKYPLKQEQVITIPSASLSVHDLILYGFTNKDVIQKNVKAMFSQEAAEKIGIPPGTYIMDICSTTKKVTLSEGHLALASDDSKNQGCGIKPDKSGRGCSVSQTGKDVTLTTLLMHIKVDMYGAAIDKWHPMRPEHLQWTLTYVAP